MRSGASFASTLLGVLFLSGILLGQPVFAQRLELAAEAGAKGELSSMAILLRSPTQAKPVALQWETTIHDPRVTAAGDTLLAGAVAQGAGKGIRCGVKAQSAESRTYFCLMFGGQQTIADGVVARLRFTASEAAAASVRVTVERGVAVYLDLKRVELEPKEIVILLRSTASRK